MGEKKKGNYLTSKQFLLNLFALFVFTIAGYLMVKSWLDYYTHHGESIDVPDLRGRNLIGIPPLLKGHNFQYEVVDSLYDADKLPGTVLDQDPAPGSKVKRNRTLYITINATNPPDVKMPDLIDVSFRQAEAILESFGLITGDITYKPDLAKNAVLEQYYEGRPIKPGTLIPKGSVIDLALGDGLVKLGVSVPNLVGLTRNEAASMLRRYSLNIGLVEYDDEDDKIGARIYKQFPAGNDLQLLKEGDSVDIWLR